MVPAAGQPTSSVGSGQGSGRGIGGDAVVVQTVAATTSPAAWSPPCSMPTTVERPSPSSPVTMVRTSASLLVVARGGIIHSGAAPAPLPPGRPGARVSRRCAGGSGPRSDPDDGDGATCSRCRRRWGDQGAVERLTTPAKPVEPVVAEGLGVAVGTEDVDPPRGRRCGGDTPGPGAGRHRAPSPTRRPASGGARAGPTSTPTPRQKASSWSNAALASAGSPEQTPPSRSQ